jgi:capsular polysaccharide biosynthesis protein
MDKEQENQNFETQIDLKVIAHILMYRWPLFLASLLIGGILLFTVSQVLLPKMYMTSIELFVNNTEFQSDSDLTTGDIDASQKLANTYIVILKNPAILKQVSEEIGNALSMEELEEAISMNAVEDTEVVRISATTLDPFLSTKVCNAYAKIAPEVLERVVKAGSVEIIGEAAPEQDPVSPNVIRNTAIGALAALFITAIAVYLSIIFDNTVKSGFDLRQRFEVPILGEIPSFSTASGKDGKK